MDLSSISPASSRNPSYNPGSVSVAEPASAILAWAWTPSCTSVTSFRCIRAVKRSLWLLLAWIGQLIVPRLGTACSFALDHRGATCTREGWEQTMCRHSLMESCETGDFFHGKQGIGTTQTRERERVLELKNMRQGWKHHKGCGARLVARRFAKIRDVDYSI